MPIPSDPVGIGEVGTFCVKALEQSVPTKPNLTTLDVNLNGVLYSEWISGSHSFQYNPPPSDAAGSVLSQ